MQVKLYYKTCPEGRVFDQDSAKEAKRKGWYEKDPEVVKQPETEKPKTKRGQHGRKKVASGKHRKNTRPVRDKSKEPGNGESNCGDDPAGSECGGEISGGGV